MILETLILLIASYIILLLPIIAFHSLRKRGPAVRQKVGSSLLFAHQQSLVTDEILTALVLRILSLHSWSLELLPLASIGQGVRIR